MNLAEEQWETIKEFPNYMISSLSRVLNKSTLKMVSVSMHQHGFRVVRLWKNGKTKLFKIYRLKAIAFIPNPLNKSDVNHLDGNRLNEDLQNLEWVTERENMRHAIDNGFAAGQFYKGQKGMIKNGVSKLSKEDAELIKRWYKSGFYDELKIHKVFPITGPYATRLAKS